MTFDTLFYSHQSLNEDSLNFSTGTSLPLSLSPLFYSFFFLLLGSGYSILSEIEHQLGLRGNKSSPSPPPGQDTLNEEDEKRKFFEQLEQGRGSSLDYSELNRQLSDTGLTGLSLRYMYMCTSIVYMYCIYFQGDRDNRKS